MLIGNARMYSVAPGAAAAWRALLGEVSRRAGVALDIIDHAYPAKLSDLWARDDLGCVFMCGWPYVKDPRGRHLLAAPVPDAAWSHGAPLYRTDFLVAADSGLATLEACFGHRYAYTSSDSHSGYNVPRAALAGFAGGASLFAEVVGPLVTVRRAVEAVAEHRAEVTAVDSYALSLLARHEPALAGQVRVVASSPPSPIPPLVAAAGVSDAALAALRAALIGLAGDGAGRALLGEVCLTRFVAVEPSVYAATLAAEPAAMAADYAAIR